MQNNFFHDFTLKIKKDRKKTLKNKFVFNPFIEPYTHAYNFTIKNKIKICFTKRYTDFQIKYKRNIKTIRKFPIFEKLPPVICNWTKNITLREKTSTIKIDFDLLSYYRDAVEEKYIEEKNILINYFYAKNYEEQILELKKFFNIHFYYNETDQIVAKWDGGYISIKRGDGIKKLHKIFNRENFLINFN